MVWMDACRSATARVRATRLVACRPSTCCARGRVRNGGCSGRMRAAVSCANAWRGCRDCAVARRCVWTMLTWPCRVCAAMSVSPVASVEGRGTRAARLDACRGVVRKRVARVPGLPPSHDGACGRCWPVAMPRCALHVRRCRRPWAKGASVPGTGAMAIRRVVRGCATGRGRETPACFCRRCGAAWGGPFVEGRGGWCYRAGRGPPPEPGATAFTCSAKRGGGAGRWPLVRAADRREGTRATACSPAGGTMESGRRQENGPRRGGPSVGLPARLRTSRWPARS